MLEPGQAQQRWEHLTFRVLHETLPHLHREAGALVLVAANVTAAIALAGWRVLTKRMVYFCQALHTSGVVRNYFANRSRRRQKVEDDIRLLYDGSDIETL